MVWCDVAVTLMFVLRVALPGPVPSHLLIPDNDSSYSMGEEGPEELVSIASVNGDSFQVLENEFRGLSNLQLHIYVISDSNGAS